VDGVAAEVERQARSADSQYRLRRFEIGAVEVSVEHHALRERLPANQGRARCRRRERDRCGHGDEKRRGPSHA
jgi:hypothetical protein